MMIKKIVRLFQILWVLPAALFWWAYILFAWIVLRDFSLRGFQEFGVAKFAYIGLNSTLHKRMWRDWCGLGVPCAIIYKYEMSETTMKHELTHCHQRFRWGFLYDIIYLIILIYIYFTNKEKHPYLDHPFEIEARKEAGQLITIPVEYWPVDTNGAKDRWPWW